MGITASRATSPARRILWCDTEGGMRHVALWDVTCIEETADSLRAQRFVSVSDATKHGRARLRKDLPTAIYRDSLITGSTCSIRYSCNEDGELGAVQYVNADVSLKNMLSSYVSSNAGSVVVAWNMRGHDRHVLCRAVGDKVLKKVTLWDGLPWFRSKYQLPKNTMSSSKPGTPRAVFQVPNHGAAHSSFADAAHMRDVVRRSAYCLRQDGLTDIAAHTNATRAEQFDAACKEIEESVSAAEWCDVADSVWTTGSIPDSIYKVAHST